MKHSVRVQQFGESRWKAGSLILDHVTGTIALIRQRSLFRRRDLPRREVLHFNDVAAIKIELRDDPNGFVYALGIILVINLLVGRLLPGIDDTWLEPIIDLSSSLLGMLLGYWLGSINRVPALSLTQHSDPAPEPEMGDPLLDNIDELLQRYEQGEIGDRALRAFANEKDIQQRIKSLAYARTNTIMAAAARVIPIRSPAKPVAYLKLVRQLLMESHQKGFYLTGTIWQGPGYSLRVARDIYYLMSAHDYRGELPDRGEDWKAAERAAVRGRLLTLISLAGIVGGLAIILLQS